MPPLRVMLEGHRPPEIVMGYWREVLSVEENASISPLEIIDENLGDQS